MRNYKNESNWKRDKYDEIRAHIEKELGAELRAELKRNNETIAGWIRSKAIEYVKGGTKYETISKQNNNSRRKGKHV